MGKSQEEFQLISPDDYDVEIEEQVAAFMRDTVNLPVNDKIYERVVEPEFDGDKKAKKEWEIDQIKKIHNGDGESMCGKMYFWFHYAKIKNIKGGAISPEYRVCDNEWFLTIEKCQESEEWGVVCVKRRRVGASWKEAADILHDCLTKPHFHVGLNSKSERDSEHLFAKILFIYERLPSFLRAKIGRRHGMHLEFFRKKKLEDGTVVRRGLQSEITVVPPTDTAYEGLMLSKWVCDEAGKIPNLPQMWSFTEDCLMQEYTRAGMPVLFGTSGDISTTGGGLMHMWDKAEQYKLKRFFFAGWMGIAVDEYGNDMKEEVIRWILYKRVNEAKKGMKAYTDFLQRYPLTIDEAFSQAGSGLGDVVKINAQKAELRSNPPMIKTGKVSMNLETGAPEFRPNPFGFCKIYEHPKPNVDYILACDPADHDDAGEEASELSLHIMAMPSGLEPPRLVCEFAYRPQKVKDFYNEAAMLAIYYNNGKVLIERNRYGMIQHFKENGFNHLLEWRPPAINSVMKRRANEIGIHMTEEVKIYMEGLISDYIDDYCQYIPFVDLLNEILEYGKTNTDRVISFGLCLIMLKSKLSYRRNKDVKQENTRVPNISYQNVNGKLVRKAAKVSTSKSRQVWQ